MIDRYISKEIQNIWNNKHKLAYWIEIEMIALKFMKEHEIIPKINIPNIYIYNLDKNKVINIDDSDKIFNINIKEFEYQCKIEEDITKHDVVAFIHVLEKVLNIKYIHYGMTSSDLCDTASSLMIKETYNIINPKLRELCDVLKTTAYTYKDTIMLGRTHGKYAEPITFGLVLLNNLCEIYRGIIGLSHSINNIMIGKMSGSVGTYAHINTLVEEDVMRKLGLRCELASNQIISRDRYATMISSIAILATSIERLAIEIRSLSRSDINEVSEGFTNKQKGSSSMPHKRNPIKSENICGISRMLRSYVSIAMENMLLWHQRDISHSSAERIMIPDSFHLLYHIINNMINIVSNLQVNTEIMKKHVINNVDEWCSQTMMLNNILNNDTNRHKSHDDAQHHKIHNTKNVDELIKYHIRHIDKIFNEVEKCTFFY